MGKQVEEEIDDENLLRFFKEEYLDERGLSDNSKKNIWVSVRRFFIWHKQNNLGKDEEEFVTYLKPSTEDPEYTAEEITEMTRREITDIIWGDDQYGKVNAERCLELEKQKKDRKKVKEYFERKIRAGEKLGEVFVSMEEVKGLRVKHIKDFISDYLKDEKDVRKGTASKYVSSLHHFINFYSTEGYFPIRGKMDLDNKDSPVRHQIKDMGKNNKDDENDEGSKKKSQGGVSLPFRVVRKLVEDRGGKMERAMIMTMAKTGIRRSELTRIKMKHVHLDEKWIYLTHRKGGKDGVVVFDEECKHYLKEYIETKKHDSPDDYLFTYKGGNKFDPGTITKKYRAWAKNSELKKYRGPHDLRHTFASHHRKEIEGTEEGEEIMRRVQMSHSENKNTGENYSYEFHEEGERNQKPIEERYRDYEKAVPEYTPYVIGR